MEIYYVILYSCCCYWSIVFRVLEEVKNHWDRRMSLMEDIMPWFFCCAVLRYNGVSSCRDFYFYYQEVGIRSWQDRGYKWKMYISMIIFGRRRNWINQLFFLRKKDVSLNLSKKKICNMIEYNGNTFSYLHLNIYFIPPRLLI